MSTKKPKSQRYPKDLLEQATEFIVFDSANPPVPPLDELSRRRLITGAIDQLEEEEKRKEFYRGTGFSARTLLIIGTGAILLTAIAVFLLAKDSDDKTQLESAPQQEHLATETTTQENSAAKNASDQDSELIAVKLVSSAKNPTSLSSAPEQGSIGVGSSIETSTEPLHLEATGRARYRLEANSKIRVTEVTKDLVECFLDHGEVFVNVDPSKKSPQVVIATPHGKVRVTGTVFTVSVSKEDTQVKVLEGTVAVESTNSPALEVSSGFQATMSGSQPKTFAMRQLSQNSVSNNVASSTIEDMPESTAGNDGIKETPGDSIDDETKSVSSSPAITPSSLLRNAQTLRKQRLWKEASVAYQIVASSFPDSAQADIAGVSLAMIQLSHLGQPGKALTNLDGYLQNNSGGVLAEEASFGRIRALHTLNRQSEQRSAIESFRKTFPDSLRTEELDSMLEQLPEE